MTPHHLTTLEAAEQLLFDLLEYTDVWRARYPHSGPADFLILTHLPTDTRFTLQLTPYPHTRQQED